MYARTGDDLIVLVGDAASKQWWRNVQGGADIILLLGGHTGAARADILTEEDARSRALTSYLERFPRAGGACVRPRSWSGSRLCAQAETGSSVVSHPRLRFGPDCDRAATPLTPMA